MRYIIVEEMDQYLNGDLPDGVLPRCRAVATLTEAQEAGFRLAREFYQLPPEVEVGDELAREFYSQEGTRGIALVFDSSSRASYPVPYNGEPLDDLGSDLPPVVIQTA